MLEKKIIKQLIKIFGSDDVLIDRKDLIFYQYDASLDKGLPDAVVFPRSVDQIVSLVHLCNQHHIPLIPRGSGSNLSGGTVASWGGIIIQFSHMNRILEIDLENQCAVVEPGVYNLDLQNALAPYKFYFAPDPASQRVATIGGNVAENAGGPHCIKYGVTLNHILGLEVVTADGTVQQFGGKALRYPGYDLMSVLIGSEGTLGIVTKAIVRILPQPEAIKTMLAIFDQMADAARAVSEIIARGIIPATLEMMDKPIIQTVEQKHHLGYPMDAEAILLLELDGPWAGLDSQAEEINAICRQNGAIKIEVAATSEQRDALWKGRRLSFGSLTMLQPSVMIADGTVPRSKVPAVLQRVMEICQNYGLKVGNVFHAGDGNLHPFILFDDRNEVATEKVKRACMEILDECIKVGGTISGEHGIGLEKKESMKILFSNHDLEAMMAIKRVFDPKNIFNPNKIFPVLEADNI
ncbi:MAG: FAD-binding protein [candidate division KSB1 bacterium]|nr:FAD-binding protein [candidate division KSB1 bacterium]MDZ7318504.1 FAD-binding protein [candidate division KSB1 bacterium]MDZ7340011.1 FAD-binding protein [candidate division KSB1 bacterium]